MGLEDREWRREELRQQGHKASWDTFRAKGPTPHEPVSPAYNEPGTYDKTRLGRIRRLLKGGGADGVSLPAKKRTPPSYIHLQAQEILEARAGRASLIWRVSTLLSILAVAFVYWAF